MKALFSIVAATVATCVAVPAAVEAQDVAAGQNERQLIPAGHGTLKQDEFTVQLRSGPLLIKVTPLAETVIRTAAPDTYDRLRALAASRRSEAENRSGSMEPQLFLVSFFSHQPDVSFQPEDLQLIHQGRPMRAAILPITPGWGTQQLKQQDLQTAIYAFPDPIDYDTSLIVQYGTVQSDSWQKIITKLDTEKNKILARSGS